MDFWHVVLVAVGVTAFWSFLFRSGGATDSVRLARLERKVDVLLRHHGLAEPPPPAVSERIWSHLSAGNKIQAIKALRQEQPGLSLKEAKDQIDALSLQHPARWV